MLIMGFDPCFHTLELDVTGATWLLLKMSLHLLLLSHPPDLMCGEMKHDITSQLSKFSLVHILLP